MREDIAPFKKDDRTRTILLHGIDDKHRKMVEEDKVQIILEAIAEGWDINIRYAIIDGDLDIGLIADQLKDKDNDGRSIIKGNIVIYNSVIAGKAYFTATRDNTFAGSNGKIAFTRGVVFTSTTFSHDADFSRAKFSDYTEFCSATFNGHADFIETVFSSPFRFGYCHFGKDVNFTGVKFCDNVPPHSLDSIGDSYVRSSIKGAHCFFQMAGERYWSSGNYNEASNSFRNAKVEYEKEGKYDDAAMMFQNIGERYLNLKNYALAENCFREARIEYDKDSNYKESGNMYVKEKESFKLKLSLVSSKNNLVARAWLCLWKHTCNYGESHWRFIGCVAAIILIFAIIYMPIIPYCWWPLVRWCPTITFENYPYQDWNSIYGVLFNIVTASYFSVVTFATLGFGDISPVSITGKIATISEVILGYVMFGILITLVARKMTRS